MWDIKDVCLIAIPLIFLTFVVLASIYDTWLKPVNRKKIIKIRLFTWYITCIRSIIKPILFFLFTVYVNSCASNLAYTWHKQNDWRDEETSTVHDEGFHVIPELGEQFQEISELIYWLFKFSLTVLCIAPLVLNFNAGHCPSLARRYCITNSLLMWCRLLTYLGTTFPSTNYHCLPGSEVYLPPLSVSEILKRIDGVHGCGDMMFSGHMSIVTVTGCVFVDYLYKSFPHLSPKTHPNMKKHIIIIIGFLITLQGVLIISARKHYTADVLVGVYVSVFAYFTLKQLVPELDCLKDDEETEHTMDISMNGVIEMISNGSARFLTYLEGDGSVVTKPINVIVNNNNKNNNNSNDNDNSNNRTTKKKSNSMSTHTSTKHSSFDDDDEYINNSNNDDCDLEMQSMMANSINSSSSSIL